MFGVEDVELAGRLRAAAVHGEDHGKVALVDDLDWCAEMELLPVVGGSGIGKCGGYDVAAAGLQLAVGIDEDKLGTGEAVHFAENGVGEREVGVGERGGDALELIFDLCASATGGEDGAERADCDNRAEQDQREGEQDLVAEGAAHGGVRGQESGARRGAYVMIELARLSRNSAESLSKPVAPEARADFACHWHSMLVWSEVGIGVFWRVGVILLIRKRGNWRYFDCSEIW